MINFTFCMCITFSGSTLKNRNSVSLKNTSGKIFRNETKTEIEKRQKESKRKRYLQGVGWKRIRKYKIISTLNINGLVSSKID